MTICGGRGYGRRYGKCPGREGSRGFVSRTFHIEPTARSVYLKESQTTPLTPCHPSLSTISKHILVSKKRCVSKSCFHSPGSPTKVEERKSTLPRWVSMTTPRTVVSNRNRSSEEDPSRSSSHQIVTATCREGLPGEGREDTTYRSLSYRRPGRRSETSDGLSTHDTSTSRTTHSTCSLPKTGRGHPQ